MYEPIEIDPHDRSLLEKIGRLRVLAWSTVMPDAAERTQCWLDEFELAARHWCIFHGGEPVAAARMSIHQRIEDVPDKQNYSRIFSELPLTPIACFSRLVVHPNFRGRGLARRLDELRMAVARTVGSRIAVIGLSIDSRIKRFRQLGFSSVGEPILEACHFLDGILAQPLVYRFPEPAPMFAFNFGERKAGQEPL